MRSRSREQCPRSVGQWRGRANSRPACWGLCSCVLIQRKKRTKKIYIACCLVTCGLRECVPASVVKNVHVISSFILVYPLRMKFYCVHFYSSGLQSPPSSLFLFDGFCTLRAWISGVKGPWLRKHKQQFVYFGTRGVF